jgi:hypothetical protein
MELNCIPANLNALFSALSFAKPPDKDENQDSFVSVLLKIELK